MDNANYSNEKPYYIFSLSDDALDKIEEYYNTLDEDAWVPMHQKYGDNDNFRVCDIHAVIAKSYPAMIGTDCFNFINDKKYEFDIDLFEYQMMRYDVGGNFGWHCDYGVSPQENYWRKLSLTIQLSEPDEYEGGELIIVDYFNQWQQMPKERGAAVIFDARCPHKVNPVLTGERKAIVGWANGPKLR